MQPTVGASRMGCRGLRNSALAALALVALTACASATPTPHSAMVLPGDPQAVLAAPDVRGEGGPPPGVELAEAGLSWDGKILRGHFAPRDDLWKALATGQLARPPVWSLSLWDADEAEEELPSFWIAATWPMTGEVLSPPVELDVWLCARDAFPEGAVSDLRHRGMGGTDRSRPSAVCMQRVDAAEASATEESIVVTVPGEELDGLGTTLLWTAVATASRTPGTVGWSHCVPTCPDTAWGFPPPEARATFPPE